MLLDVAVPAEQLHPVGADRHPALGGSLEAELALLMPEKKTAAGFNFLRCPMPGLVKAILVGAGQGVRSGEVLCVIEAMKMETALCAESDATVAKIHVQPSDIVAVDAIIMAFM